MHITDLSVSSVKGIRYVALKPRRGLNLIAGKNGSGKTSLCDAIAFTLGGANLCPAHPIREGEDEAEVSLKIEGDESRNIPAMTVVRKFFRREDGSIKTTLDITDIAGYSAGTPQTILNDLIGKKSVAGVPLGFDPLGFASLDAKKQVEILRKLAGVDTSDLDEEERLLAEKRTDANRRLKTAEAVLDKMPHYDATELIDIDAIHAENHQAQATLRLNQEKRYAVKTFDKQVESRAQEIVALRQEIAKCQRRLDTAQTSFEALSAKRSAVYAEAAGLVDPDVDSIGQRVQQATEQNNRHKANQRRAEAGKTLESVQAETDVLGASILAIRTKRREVIAQAKYPLPALSFNQECVLLNGRPFSQASAAEQLEASCAIGCSLNPDLKILFVREGSLLDQEHLEKLAEIAAKHGAQAFVELVGENREESHIILRDGMVLHADEEVLVARA